VGFCVWGQAPWSWCVFGEVALSVAVCLVPLVLSLVRSIGIYGAWCVFVWLFSRGVPGFAQLLLVGLVSPAYCAICRMPPNLFSAQW